VVGIIAPWGARRRQPGDDQPSELTPRFAALLKEVIAAKFDPTEIIVTGVDEEIARASPRCRSII
jgi:hypothetical protein